MSHFEFEGKQIEINEEGFLINPDEWTKEMAVVMAKEQENLEELNDSHWAVINFIREYYLEHNSAPMVRKVCKASGVKLTQIYDLFPSGPAKGAAKLAGLPKPDGCV